MEVEREGWGQRGRVVGVWSVWGERGKSVVACTGTHIGWNLSQYMCILVASNLLLSGLCDRIILPER